MAASSPIGKVGTRSRRPTGSSGLTGGTGRRSTPVASLPAKTVGHIWRSISPGSESPFMRVARPLFGKATAPAKATARHRGRCTTSRSRSRKPMPPNGRSPPSGNRSVSNSIGAAGRHPRGACPHHLSPCPPPAGSVCIRTIRPPFHGRPATMVATKIWSLGIGPKADAIWKSSRPPTPRLSPPHPVSCQHKSIRAFSPSPSPSVCATKPI